MSERRSEERIDLIYYLAVFEQGTDKLIGYLSDITTKVALIISETPIDIGITFKLFIESYSLFNKTSIINFSAECIRCTRHESINYFDCGFKFTDIELEHVEFIQDLISKFKLD